MSSIVINYYTLSLHIKIILFEIWHGLKDGMVDISSQTICFERCLGFMRFFDDRIWLTAFFRAP
jgi:hypothetical protein